MSRQAKPNKRIGRPIKQPKPGERVPLGLRITPLVKYALEKAAQWNGRSLSQEAELRLERSFDMSRHLLLSRGNLWSPVLVGQGELLVGLGDDPRDYPVPEGEPPHQETIIRLKISEEDLNRLRNYFDGAPWPYDASNQEIEEASNRWWLMQEEIKRGK